MARSLLLVIPFLATASPPLAGARSSVATYDNDIACLDLETGKLLWRANPGPIEDPKLRVVDGKLIAWGEVSRSAIGQYALSLDSGRSVDMPRVGWAASSVGIELKRNLVDSRGRRFRTDEPRLAAETVSGHLIIRHLENYPGDLSIAGDIAVFTLGGAPDTDVVAYDLSKHRLRWEFALNRPDGSEPTTQSFVDERFVYVHAPPELFKLSLSDGSIVWQSTLTTAFPTYFALYRQGSKLLVAGYAELFHLDSQTGKVRWHFRDGGDAHITPMVHGKRVFFGVGRRPATSNVLDGALSGRVFASPVACESRDTDGGSLSNASLT